VDGIDDRNPRGAAAQLRPNIDAMQEFKMEVGGYSAEYGKMAGGILNMVLKSGTNSYDGALFEYFRNDILDSRAYFDQARLPFHENQWGGVIQGPLSIPKVYSGKDRTFYMFSWESFRNVWGASNLGSCAPGSSVSRRDVCTVFARLRFPGLLVDVGGSVERPLLLLQIP